jgi:YaiO family outer membrane protein
VRAFGAALAIGAMLAVPPAGADETEFGLTQTSTGFSSSSNGYGPWHTTSLTARHGQPGSAIQAEVDYGSDQNAIDPSRGTFASASYTRDWSETFYSFVAVGGGTGNPFPTMSAYAEANFKMGRVRRLVLTGAYGVDHFASGFGTNYTSVGGTYYWPKVAFTARAVVANNTDSPTTVSGLYTVDYQRNPGRSYVVTVQAGPQNYLASIPGLLPSRAAYTGYAATAVLKQRVAAHATMSLGFLLEQQQDTVARQPAFTARGLIFGFSFIR